MFRLIFNDHLGIIIFRENFLESVAPLCQQKLLIAFSTQWKIDHQWVDLDLIDTYRSSIRTSSKGVTGNPDSLIAAQNNTTTIFMSSIKSGLNSFG